MFEFTSESVLPGHPDKLADQISDAILDSILRKDKYAHVAIDTAITHGECFIYGEVDTNAVVDYEKIARNTIRKIGYTSEELGMDYKTCKVRTNIIEQSPDIKRGVGIKSRKIGAGDQGIMFGYACKQTQVLMPLPIELAHGIGRELVRLRLNKKLSYLRPDGKTQVTVLYDDANNPVKITSIVIAVQHEPDIKLKHLRDDVKYHISKLLGHLVDDRTKWVINGTGRFVIGGPRADSGVTGKKTTVDTYGGWARNGGGSLSGKDATKVDRSATYMTRYIAKNIVAAGLADEIEIQLAYAIGRVNPVSMYVSTNKTSYIPEDKLYKIINEIFDTTPSGMIEILNLRKPIYSRLAVFGHMGRKGTAWENIDMADELNTYL
ncbi:methionine adenosyltransferase [Candidatus Micrarchaeota archaeon]|nr:methionine adenosyltransferase [Candidatus Micrarchaeota archaeon]